MAVDDTGCRDTVDRMSDPSVTAPLTPPAAPPVATVATPPAPLAPPPPPAPPAPLDPNAAARALGFNSAADLETMRKTVADMQAAETERQRAAMTETDRQKSLAEEQRTRADSEKARADAAEAKAALVESCAKHGIKDTADAAYRRKDVPAVEREAKLREWCADPTERTRLGLDALPGAAPVNPEPASTSTTPPNNPIGRQPPPTPPIEDTSRMTRAQFEEYKRKRHGA